MNKFLAATALVGAFAAPALADTEEGQLVISTQSLPVVAGAAGSATIAPIVVGGLLVGIVVTSISSSSGSHGSNVGP